MIRRDVGRAGKPGQKLQGQLQVPDLDRHLGVGAAISSRAAGGGRSSRPNGIGAGSRGKGWGIEVRLKGSVGHVVGLL